MRPGCETETGCLVPSPGPEGQRVLKLRSLLMRLGNLIDPGTVCRTFGADLDDLELLAVAEDELKESVIDGEGHQTADQGEC